MKSVNINFPNGLKMGYRGIFINLKTPVANVVTIDKVDYIPYYLQNDLKGNKGSNVIIKLLNAQDWDEDEGYPEIPDLIMKICLTPKFAFEASRSLRFAQEIQALAACNQINTQNTVSMSHYGLAKIMMDNGILRDYRYYTMEFAPEDLATFLANNNLPLLERVALCLEICESLKLIWDAGYYHRDIKPDNILFSKGTWKIADLGLVAHREKENTLDEKGEWIGPRGWQSPESLNKFLAEKKPWGNKFDCKIDHQSDLYQLGKLIWFIIQGNCPEGGVRRRDFIFGDDGLYQVIRTLLNNHKKSRIKDIEELIISLKKIHTNYLKSNLQFDLHSVG